MAKNTKTAQKVFSYDWHEAVDAYLAISVAIICWDVKEVVERQ